MVVDKGVRTILQGNALAPSVIGVSISVKNTVADLSPFGGIQPAGSTPERLLGIHQIVKEHCLKCV